MTIGNQLVFDKDSIFLEDKPNHFVMMEWEKELMKETAKVVCSKGGHILEIGFGMGILSTFIQEQPNVKKHTIVEAHPEVYKRALEWSKKYPNVEILFGDWIEIADKIIENKYDGIHYDADCINFYYFNTIIVEKGIRTGGIFSYFEPKGRDVYNYNERLRKRLVEITCDIPKNIYHNSKHCFVTWVEF